MSVDDRNRNDLSRRLETVLGVEEANTLMAHLPPTTWRDLATRADVEHLGIALRAEMHGLATELRAEMVNGVNRQIKWIIGFGATWTTALLAATQLLA